MVVGPAFIGSAGQFWKFKLTLNILKIVAEAGPGQAFDILDDEGSRFDSANDIDGGREHIPIIAVGGMLAAHGERLAGWPARNEFDFILPFAEINVSHVVVEQTNF